MQCICTLGSALQALDFRLISDVIRHRKNPAPSFRGARLNNSHETLIRAALSRSARCTFH